MQFDPTITLDHQEIRAWAEGFGGRPQKIIQGGVTFIRIDILGKEDDTFLSQNKPPMNISWEEFFKIFEDLGLAFIYEKKEIIDPSLAYHFIKRDNLGDDEEGYERKYNSLQGVALRG